MELFEALGVLGRHIGTVLALFGAGSATFAAVFFKKYKKWERIAYRREDKIQDLKHELTDSNAKLIDADNKVQRLIQLVGDDDRDIWLRQAAFPEDYTHNIAKSIPILMFANLKGGVGKTTLAANVCGYFDTRGEKVLLIVDYQGSLTATAVGNNYVPSNRPGAVGLLSGDCNFLTHSIQGSSKDSRIADCYYSFANLENRLMLEWLAGFSPDDVRYRLARVLLSKAVQDHFDRVIIDTGPRVTTGFMNALCTATHLVIPTQLDRLSVDAVQSFLITLDQLRPTLMPGLRNGIRIVATQKSTGGSSTEAEQNAIDLLHRQLERRGYVREYFLSQAMVPIRTDFGKSAAWEIAYFKHKAVRDVIDPVGESLARFAPSRLREAA